MTENLELYLKIITTVAGIFVAYHKFIMSEINKKMDRDDCENSKKYWQKKRLNIEIMFEERTKTIFKKQEEIQEDLKIIKEHIIQK